MHIFIQCCQNHTIHSHIFVCLFVCFYISKYGSLNSLVLLDHIFCVIPERQAIVHRFFSTHYPMPSEQLTSMRLSKSFRQSLDISYFSLLPCLCFNILQNNLTLIFQIFPIVEKILWNSTSAQPLDT